MKKGISVLLALTMALTVLLPAFAAAPRAWNAEKKGFVLTDGPEIVRLSEDSDEFGTSVTAFYRNTSELRELADAYYAAFREDDKLYGDLMGHSQEDTNADLFVDVQFAYSFDGTDWVNDWEVGNAWYCETDFSRDGDEFNEYCGMPTKNQNIAALYDSATVINGRDNCFTGQWCSPAEGMSIEEAITLCNNAILQGKGEFKGCYEKDADESYYGMMVDFNQYTIYVKARYRVYNELSIWENDLPVMNGIAVYYSDWGPVKTFNNDTADVRSQNCVPDTNVLRSDAAPVLKLLSSKREKVTERVDGKDIQITESRCQISVDYPAVLDTALARFYSLDDDRDTREELTGEFWGIDLLFEVRVNDGDWYYFDKISADEPYYEFSNNKDWTKEKLETLGLHDGDTLYMRARLYDEDSYRMEIEDGALACEKVFDNDDISVRSGHSNIAALDLSGIYRVTYELNGGSFAWGTEQMNQFDDDTSEIVNLKSDNYIPEKRNFRFIDWYEDADFTKPVESFDTSEKRSRTYYAKWEELPYYELSYNNGAITGGVWNPNPERIYPDDGPANDGVITLADAEYTGAAFLGWYDAATGGNKVTTLSYAAMTGNMTLYAHWELPTYTITYSGAGTDYINDTRNPASFRIDPAAGVSVKLYAPAKTGYTFDGWYYDDAFKHALPYNEEANAWMMTEGNNVTVYARFIVGRWNINYVLGLDDAWNGANPEEHTYGEAVELKNPSRTGYTFEGWYKDQAFTQPIGVIPDDTVGEVTVYAKWTAIQYTIKYDLRDPDAEKCFENVNPTVRGIDDEVALKPLAPVTKLYKFIGWFDNVNFDGDPVTKIAAGTDKNVTLYAKIQAYMWGDVDLDGSVTASDARLLLRRAVDLKDPEFTDDLIPWGDFDNDGRITSSDARTALRMAVGLDTVESLGLPPYPAGI